MRMILAVAGAAMLAACGGPADGTYETEDGTVTVDNDLSGGQSEMRFTDKDGNEATISTGNSVVAELPDGFSIYPGSTVVSTSNVTANDGKGTIVFMTTSDSPAKVAEFYKGQAEAKGIAISLENTTPTSKMIAGESAQGFSFTLTASATGDSTSAQLMVGTDLQQ